MTNVSPRRKRLWLRARGLGTLAELGVILFGGFTFSERTLEALFSAGLLVAAWMGLGREEAFLPVFVIMSWIWGAIAYLLLLVLAHRESDRNILHLLDKNGQQTASVEADHPSDY